MHVVHFYDGHEQVCEGRGSVPGVVWNLARETAAQGHDVTVVERQWAGLDTQAIHETVEFHRLDLSTGAEEPWTRVPYEEVTSPLGAMRLVGDRTNFAIAGYRALRQLDPDVIHVHLPFAASVLVTIAPWLRDQMVYTAHLGDLRMNMLDTDADSDVDVPGVLEYFSPDVFLAKRVAHTTVLNPGIRDAFVGAGVSDESVSVVPNGVDIDRFADPDAAAVRTVNERYNSDDRPLVLFVGTVMPRKGVLELVEAFEQVLDQCDQQPRLLIAGDNELDPGYVARVETLITESSLDSNIDMVGFVDEDLLPALYSAADVFVVPSLEEGFGMTAIEALAAGTPVVGTRVGGLPEIITPGETGTLAKPGDSDELAVGLLELLSSKEGYAQQTSERASEYAWGGVADRVQEIYEEVTA